MDIAVVDIAVVDSAVLDIGKVFFHPYRFFLLVFKFFPCVQLKASVTSGKKNL